MFGLCVTLVNPPLASCVRFAVSRLSSDFVRSVLGTAPTLISIAGFQELTWFPWLRPTTYRKARRTSGPRARHVDEFWFPHLPRIARDPGARFWQCVPAGKDDQLVCLRQLSTDILFYRQSGQSEIEPL
jgi:hypothetical protein